MRRLSIFACAFLTATAAKAVISPRLPIEISSVPENYNSRYYKAPPQEFASMACSPEVCLAAWFERNSDNIGSTVYAGRFDVNGRPIDGRGFRISRSSMAGVVPPVRVVFASSTFLLTWNHIANETREVYAVRITAQGTVIDRKPIVAVDHIGYEGNFALTTDGTMSLIVWGDYRNSRPEMRGTRVVDGVVLDPVGFIIAAGSYSAPVATFDGEDFAIAWRNDRAFVAARASREGVALDTEPIKIIDEPPYGGDLVAAASNGERTVFMMNDWWSGRTVISSISKNGNVNTPPIELSGSGGALTSVGRDFILIWRIGVGEFVNHFVGRLRDNALTEALQLYQQPRLPTFPPLRLTQPNTYYFYFAPTSIVAFGSGVVVVSPSWRLEVPRVTVQFLFNAPSRPRRAVTFP